MKKVNVIRFRRSIQFKSKECAIVELGSFHFLLPQYLNWESTASDPETKQQLWRVFLYLNKSLSKQDSSRDNSNDSGSRALIRKHYTIQWRDRRNMTNEKGKNSYETKSANDETSFVLHIKMLLLQYKRLQWRLLQQQKQQKTKNRITKTRAWRRQFFFHSPPEYSLDAVRAKASTLVCASQHCLERLIQKWRSVGLSAKLFGGKSFTQTRLGRKLSKAEHTVCHTVH